MSCTAKSVLIRVAVGLLMLSAACLGQGGNFVRQVISSPVSAGGTGQPISNAIVRVCTSSGIGTPCSPLVANVYSDPALSVPIGNPFAADINGFYSIFLSTGAYLIQESTPVGAGFTYSESYLAFVNGTGTVSIVNLSLPFSLFSVSGSGCTFVCSLTASFVTQSPYTVFANCTSATSVPLFCPIVANMIPATLNATTINGLTVGGNETISGTLGVTGAATLSSTLAAGASTLSSLTVPGTSALSGGGSLGGTFSGNPLFSGLPAFSTANFTTGIQLGGSYGTAGQCLSSTGSGTSFTSNCGIGGIPAIAVGPGAGTSGAASISLLSRDGGGVVSVTSGSGPPTTGIIATVTFGSPFPTGGFCTFAQYGTSGAVPSAISMTANKTAFELNLNGVALSASTFYQWTYTCSGF